MSIRFRCFEATGLNWLCPPVNFGEVFITHKGRTGGWPSRIVCVIDIDY